MVVRSRENDEKTDRKTRRMEKIIRDLIFTFISRREVLAIKPKIRINCLSKL
jgi:hypothetical protein